MKYKFCEQLQKSIFLGYDTLIHCCTCDDDRSPTFVYDYKGQRVNWRAVMDEKLRLQEEAKKGKIPFSACKNCHFLKEKEWEDGGYINEITVAHWTKCNCNCFYCFTARDKQNFNSYKHYRLMPLLNDMQEAGILKFDGTVRFLGGDVAMFDEFEEFLRFFIENGEKSFYIPTSGIKFLPIVEEVLEKGIGEVIVSPDSGNRELYKKIKRVDAYDVVRENIRKYAAAAKRGGSMFRSKYIVIPFVNDTKEAVDEWLNECVELGVENIANDCEENFFAKYSQSIPKHLPQIMDYIHEKADELGLNTVRFRYGVQLFYELKNGTAKIAKTKINYEKQKKFVEDMLKR